VAPSLGRDSASSKEFKESYQHGWVVVNAVPPWGLSGPPAIAVSVGKRGLGHSDPSHYQTARLPAVEALALAQELIRVALAELEVTTP
jgi:hypothetical protein